MNKKINKLPPAVLGSHDWWKNQKKHGVHNILKLALYILVFFLIWYAIAPLINGLHLFTWWKQQAHSLSSDYDKTNCLSFTNLTYFLHFPLYWHIGNLTGNEESQIKNEGEALMIMMLIDNYADGIVPGGALTGKALCESIIPDWPPPPALVKAYTTCGKNSTTGAAWQGWKDFTKWPPPEQTEVWKGIMYLWGAGGFCGKSATDSCDGDNFKTQPPSGGSACASQVPEESCGFPLTWMTTRDYATGKNPWLGNFLWGGYQIPYNSPVVLGYLTDAGNICNTGVQTGSLPMKILLGNTEGGGTGQGKTQRGGWWGAIASISSNFENTTKSQIYDYFWQNVSEQESTSGAGNSQGNPTPSCTSGSITTGVTTGVGAAAGVGMGAAMLWATCPECAIVVGLVGAGAGAAAGMNAAGKGGCCAAKLGAPPCCKTKPNSCPHSGKPSGPGCNIM